MDGFGDRMKRYERRWTGQKVMPGVPVIARIDGKCFSSWTRGLPKPYCQRLSDLMVETTKTLVDESSAVLGYTQSDEITLVWSDSQTPYFDGKAQKMTSVLASVATAQFNSMIPEFVPDRKGKLALFDCRVWDVPCRVEAANAVLWREVDATKNSISAAARAHFSHKSLHGLSGKQMQEKLFSEAGVNWNDYPSFFKRGVYIRRTKRLKTLSDEDLARIPERHRPDGPVERTVIEKVDMPPFVRITNRSDVVFEGADPQVE